MPKNKVAPINKVSKGRGSGSKDSGKKQRGSYNDSTQKPKKEIRSGSKDSGKNGKSGSKDKAKSKKPAKGKGQQPDGSKDEKKCCPCFKTKKTQDRSRSQDSGKSKGKPRESPKSPAKAKKRGSTEANKNKLKSKDGNVPQKGKRGLNDGKTRKPVKPVKKTTGKGKRKGKGKDGNVKKKNCCYSMANAIRIFMYNYFWLPVSIFVYNYVWLPIYNFVILPFYDTLIWPMVWAATGLWKNTYVTTKEQREYIMRPDLQPYIWKKYDRVAGKRWAHQVHLCLVVISVIMQLVGRWPVILKKTRRKIIFIYRPCTVPRLYCGFVSYVFYFAFVLLIAGACSYAFEFPRIQDCRWKPLLYYHLEEKYFYKRQLFPWMIAGFMFLNSVVSSYVFQNRGEYCAAYLNFFPKAINILNIEVVSGAIRYAKYFFPIYFTLSCFQWYMAYYQCIPMINGVGAAIAWIGGRIFNNRILDYRHFPVLRNMGICFFMVFNFTGRIYICVYLFIVRMLMPIFDDYNDRLERVMNYTDPLDLRNQIMAVWGLHHLFKEHLLTIQLLRATDQLFNGVVETYALKYPLEFPQVRRRDAYYLITYFVQSCMMFAGVAFSGVSVHHSGNYAYGSIMRRSYFGRRTYGQRLFVKTMLDSYNGHFPIALTGGNYFYLTGAGWLSLFIFIYGTVLFMLQLKPSTIVDASSLFPIYQDYMNPYKLQYLYSWWENTSWTENVFPEGLRTLYIPRPFRNLSEMSTEGFQPTSTPKYYYVYDDYDPIDPKDVEDKPWGYMNN